jgi:cytoskeleton protein RodZ
MSEMDVSSSVADTPVIVSGGAMLRKAREAQGLHIAALAVSLKVPVKKLEALEADRFDLLPDTVFARALASSVCRALKIDAGPILAGLPVNVGKQATTQESGINVPFRASRDGMSLSFTQQLSKPLVLAVAALALGAVLIFFYPFGSWMNALGPTVSSNPSSSIAESSAPVMQNRVQEASVSAQVASSAAVSTSAPVASEKSVVVPVSVAPAQLSSAPASVAPAGASPKPITVSLGLRALGSSWVEVVDARGIVQLRKTLTAGEIASAAGVAPLSVVLGRADAVEVKVGGNSLDLVPMTKDNVARFEVKQ